MTSSLAQPTSMMTVVEKEAEEGPGGVPYPTSYLTLLEKLNRACGLKDLKTNMLKAHSRPDHSEDAPGDPVCL